MFTNICTNYSIKDKLPELASGGILADDMGLGKTVQMIATMVINQPTAEDQHRTTLIVVPAALLLQWKEELEMKANDIFDVHIQHGKDKIKDIELLGEKDVRSSVSACIIVFGH